MSKIYDWENDPELNHESNVYKLPLTGEFKKEAHFKSLEDGYHYSDSNMLTKEIEVDLPLRSFTAQVDDTISIDGKINMNAFQNNKKFKLVPNLSSDLINWFKSLPDNFKSSFLHRHKRNEWGNVWNSNFDFEDPRGFIYHKRLGKNGEMEYWLEVIIGEEEETEGIFIDEARTILLINDEYYQMTNSGEIIYDEELNNNHNPRR